MEAGWRPSWIKNAAIFDVESGDYYGIGQLPLTTRECFFWITASSWANANAAELSMIRRPDVRRLGLAGQMNSASSYDAELVHEEPSSSH
jgi:hypothetical protein